MADSLRKRNSMSIESSPRGKPNGSRPSAKDNPADVGRLQTRNSENAFGGCHRTLDEFEEVYAPDEDAEGKLVVAVLRQAGRLCFQ